MIIIVYTQTLHTLPLAENKIESDKIQWLLFSEYFTIIFSFVSHHYGH